MEEFFSNIPAMIISGLAILCMIVYVGVNYFSVRFQRKELAHWENEVKASDERIESIIKKMAVNRRELIDSLSNIDKILAENPGMRIPPNAGNAPQGQGGQAQPGQQAASSDDSTKSSNLSSNKDSKN